MSITITQDRYLEIARAIAGKDLVEHLAKQQYLKWRKTASNATEEEAHEYITSQLPNPGWISVQNVVTGVNGNANLATKWFRQKNTIVADTICGPYVSPEAKKQLLDYLVAAKPIEPLFCEYCEENGITYNRSAYVNFLQTTGGIERTKYHPHHQYEEFWLGSQDDLQKQLRDWSIGYTAEYPVVDPQYVNIADAANYLGIDKRKLLRWCKQQPDSYTYRNGQALISIALITELQTEWDRCRPLKMIIAQELEAAPVTRKKELTQALEEVFSARYADQLLPQGTFPQQGKNNVVKDIATVQTIIRTFINDFPCIPYTELKTICQLNTTQLRKKISMGVIVAEEVETGKFYVTPAEARRIRDLNDKYTSLDVLVSNLVEETGSIFKVSCVQHRDNLLNYCEENEFWGIECFRGEDIPLNEGRFAVFVLNEDRPELQVRLALWIEGYGREYDEKITCLLNKFVSVFPVTVKKLREFVKTKPASNALVCMIDMLFANLKKELHEMSEKQIEEDIIKPFCKNSLASAELLSEFLFSSGISMRRFTFERTGLTFDTSAYSLADFAKIMAPIVNKDVIAELHLIPKAISNQRFADLWLFVALHMFAAWRVTDFVRLPAPHLRYAPEFVLEEIKNGTYSKEDAETVADYFIMEHQLARRRPNKTSTQENIAPLYFFCPESCKEVFGTILSIAAAHYQINGSGNRTFVNPVRDTASIKAFFGPVFVKACGKSNFSGRRANKALMQAVEAVAEGDVNPLVAMNLASHLRSHKGTYGKLAETTSIYLKDAAFSGKTPEYVISQMFERGICSFAVDHLLQTCYGEQYQLLPDAHKTQVITELAMTPYSVDMVRQTVMKAQDTAIATVKDLLQEGANAVSILENLAIGAGLGKTQNDICLRKAANLSCSEGKRHNCLGCKYEIKTKALLARLAASYHDLNQSMRDTSSEIIKERNAYLGKQVLLPAAMEIAYHIKMQSNPDESDLYGQLIKEISE